MAGVEFARNLNKLAKQLVFTPRYPDMTPPSTALVISTGSLSLNDIRTRMYFLRRPRPRTFPDDPANEQERKGAIKQYLGLSHILVLLANNEDVPPELEMDDAGIRRKLHNDMGPYIELAQRRLAEILTTDTPALPYEARAQEQKIEHWTKVRRKLLKPSRGF